VERDEEFNAYVLARQAWLHKIAFLLCQDWHRAEDLVQTAVTRLYTNWRRATEVDNLDGYSRTVLVRVYLGEQRTGWWRLVTSVGRLSDTEATSAVDSAALLDLHTALAALAPRQRATVVLRFYCQLSVEETATALDCSPGTVKSQTSKALIALRRRLSPQSEEASVKEPQP
jgi:RNA polymerase sigma-70 factor (sigma-E family)